jgi:type III secretory pathway component EscT
VTAALVAALTPPLAAAALHALRLLPVAMLSPLLGGPLVPPICRFALAFALGAAASAATGAPAPALAAAPLATAAARELALGSALAFVATLPFEAARAGGRLADTLRGATLAELHVAPLRQRETALGDLFAQATVALAATAGGDRLVLAALLRSFGAVPAGAAFHAGATLDAALRAAGELVASALCVGAPAAVGVLAADVAVALAARLAPQLPVESAAAPARAGLGVLAIAIAASAVAGRLTALVGTAAELASAAVEAAP